MIKLNKLLPWQKQLLLWSYILLVCILLRGAFFYQNLNSDIRIPDTDETPFLLGVDNGLSFSQLTRRMESEGMIASSTDARFYARISGKADQIKAGEYVVTEGMSILDLLDKLASGDVYYRQVRILEGWTLAQALRAIQDHPNIIVSLDPGNPNQLMAQFGTDYYPEGLLFPDTYNFVSGTSDREIIQRGSMLMQEVLDEEWQKRAVGLPYENAYQALVMASIIEKETGRADERALIAGVFVNRLLNNMRLQTDPTVIYGLGDRFNGNLTRADLQEATPYNTYLINGLPPTPIALPGRESIEAALNPDLSGYLYFVARGDGSHYFSSTLEEHNAAVERFQLGVEN